MDLKKILDFLDFYKNKPKYLKQIGFIVGTGRCGTTILSRVLNSHSKIVVSPELQFLFEVCSHDIKLLNAESISAIIEDKCPYSLDRFFDFRGYLSSINYPQKSAASLLVGIFDAICRSYSKEIFLEQTPWYGQKLALLHEMFPDMKILHIIRDPRDVALSYKRSKWWGHLTLEQALFKWRDEALTIHEYGVLHPRNFLQFRYEELVQHPEETLETILALFNQEFEASMLDHRRLVDYRSLLKIDTISFQSAEYRKWREQEDKPIFFSDNVQGWKKVNDIDFSSKVQPIRDIMHLFGYDD